MHVLRLGAVLVLVVALLAAPAAADVVINLKAKDPVAALPAISGDGTQFLRPYRRWRKGCKKPDIIVEWGGIDPEVTEPEYSSAPLIGGCGEKSDAHAGNVVAVNESMRETQCHSAPVRGKPKEKLPATLDADDLKVDISATKQTVFIAINKLERTKGAWTGGRRVELAGVPTEVHGWYLAEKKDRRQLAVLVAAEEPDGTIGEQWVEIWLRKVPAKPKPAQIAADWLLALAENDAALLASLTAAPFERMGFEPAAGDRAEPCTKLRAAKKKDQLESVLACALVDGPARYAMLFDPDELGTIKTKQIPKDLAAHKKALSKLAGKGHTLVQFHVQQDGWYLQVVLSVKGGKVTAAAEYARPLSR
jgi:hypothetical protein